MRLWSLHPQYLDSAGLNAAWREGLLARNVLLGNTKGYTNHPQLDRFKKSADPLLYIDGFLTEIYKEAVRRGFKYSANKICIVENIDPLSVTNKQLEYEYQHLRHKLETRSPSLLSKLPNIENIYPHPIFNIVDGDIEKWEIV